MLSLILHYYNLFKINKHIKKQKISPNSNISTTFHSMHKRGKKNANEMTAKYNDLNPQQKANIKLDRETLFHLGILPPEKQIKLLHLFLIN